MISIKSILTKRKCVTIQTKDREQGNQKHRNKLTETDSQADTEKARQKHPHRETNTETHKQRH